MYGKSWGGFNGLQVAARQPSALKTIISADSTDDRYADDIHYRGGCVLAREMLSWAHVMFLWNARPPYPESMGPRYFLARLFKIQIVGNSIVMFLQQQPSQNPSLASVLFMPHVKKTFTKNFHRLLSFSSPSDYKNTASRLYRFSSLFVF